MVGVGLEWSGVVGMRGKRVRYEGTKIGYEGEKKEHIPYNMEKYVK